MSSETRASSPSTPSPIPLAESAFCASEDFSYGVQVLPVLSPRECIHVRITTQWRAARDPGEVRTAFAITLTADQLQTLIATLTQGLQNHRTHDNTHAPNPHS